MADTKVSDLPTATFPLDGTELVPIVQGGVSKKADLANVRDSLPPKTLTTTQSTTLVAAQAATELLYDLPVGTYLLKYWVVFQTAATTTGIEFKLNFVTGAVSRLVSTWYTLTTGGAAATGVADQSTGATAQMLEGKGQRANNTASGPIQGVDTATSDQFAVMEGVIMVTTAGTLQFMFASEVLTSAVSLTPGTTVTLQKVA